MLQKSQQRNIVFGSIAALFATLVILLQPPFLSTANAQAAGTELMVTWQTNSYVSPGYRGKALPTINSKIIAAVTLLDNGKVVPLENKFIQWHLNNSRINGGLGMTQMTFDAPSVAPNSVIIRATVTGYNETEVLKTIEIPLSRPEVIIEAPFIKNKIVGPTVTLKAHPFFFGVKDPSYLNFNWTVNETAPTSKEDPETLVLTIPPGAKPGSYFNVNLLIKNPMSYVETTATNISLRL